LKASSQARASFAFAAEAEVVLMGADSYSMSELPTSPLAPRPLSAMEAGVWKVDLTAPLNFTTAARVSGPLTEELLRAALPAVRARHAFLSARIERRKVGPSFSYGDGAPLSLRVVRGAGASLVEELEREINSPVESESGPLARFTLVEPPDGARWVLVTLHHSVGDGMSGAYLMRDLLAAAGQACSGQPPSLPVLPVTGSVDELIPAAHRGPRVWHQHLRFFFAQLWLLLRYGRPFKVRHDQLRYASERRTRVLPRELDPATAERLLTKTRAEGTTVHGALSAAMILGALEDSGKTRGQVAFGSPVNLRATLAPPVGEQLGFYVSMLMYTAGVTASTPFWEVARAVRRDLERALARGGQFHILDLLPRLFGLVGGGRLPSRAFTERLERLAPATTGLTNLGRLELDTTHGPLTIEACYFVACPSALGEFLATATSLHGRIFWNFVWPDPALTEAHAVALVDGIVARLRREL
jgi:hypothetical protein